MSLITTMLEIDLNGRPDNFLVIRETLKRIGIANNLRRRLYQSCHILHKRGRYYIVHFKELLALDGRPVELTPEDIQRRNNIAALLEEWNLCNILDVERVHQFTDDRHFRVLSFKESQNWDLVPKYVMESEV
ncbi:translation repressor [Vibrio phage EniLVp02]